MLTAFQCARLLLVACFATASAFAQFAVAPTQVKASLVAAETSIQPGRPLTVALRLVHDPGWHTYWLNPGTGLATTLQWRLPEGWTAGPIQWPAPKPILDAKGAITGNGYDGDLLLPVTLTPPANLAAGTVVDLRATADWLMCAEVCIPGTSEVRLQLGTSAAAPAAHPDWGPRIAATLAALPRALAEWKVSAVRDARSVVLSVSPADPSVAIRPRGLHFFSDNKLTAYELPQRARSDGQGGYKLVLPVGTEAPADATRLVGVLTAENAWAPNQPVHGLRVDVPFEPAPAGYIAAWSAPAAPERGLGLTLVFAFLGGLILNLMPCVFPVLGIKVLGFVNQSGSDPRRVVTHGLVFTAGILLSFWILAGVLLALRAGGAELGWGYQLQSPAFVLILAAVMLVFAMNLSGVFEIGLGATAIGGSLHGRSGLAGTFFSGVLATVVATPCSAPMLTPALTAALTLPALQALTVFTAVALGLSAPYLFLSAYPPAVRWLPRPGAWMETFKQFIAFPLYGTAGALLWVLAGQVDEGALLNAIIGLTILAVGVWAYGRTHAPGARPARARLGLAAVLALGAGGLWMAWPPSAEETADAIVWEKWTPATVAKLRAEGRIVYVDFTARWCATCQANKKLVFGSAAVRDSLAAKNVATLRADWTNKDPAITAELANYQRSAVPFNVIWLPGKDEPVILPEILTPGIVLEGLGG